MTDVSIELVENNQGRYVYRATARIQLTDQLRQDWAAVEASYQRHLRETLENTMRGFTGLAVRDRELEKMKERVF